MSRYVQRSYVYTNVNGHEKELATRVAGCGESTERAFRARKKDPARAANVLYGHRSARDRQWIVRHDDEAPTRQPDERYRQWFPPDRATIIVPRRAGNPFDHPFFSGAKSS